MKENRILTLRRVLCMALPLLAMAMPAAAAAQVVNDSLADESRSFTARNMARFRTLSLCWETKPAHDYTLKMNGRKIEKGRKRDVHTMMLSTKFPLLHKKKASLFADFGYSRYNIDGRVHNAERPVLFYRDAHHYYAGGLDGSYYTGLFGKPLILSANVMLDWWNHGFGMLQGRFSAIMMLVKNKDTGIHVGLMGTTLFNRVPVIPIVTYTRQLDPRLSLEIILPSHLYMRYQTGAQRISLGTSFSAESFYVKTNIRGKSETCCFRDIIVKPELKYEYILNRHFYFSACAGLAASIKSGLYKKNRKEVKFTDENGNSDKEPILEQSYNAEPFLKLGFSYSFFR